jgi:hypothetical protein
MKSAYESLICDLKIKLNNKKIDFKRIFELINNHKYDEIIEITQDDNIRDLINSIKNERETIGSNLEKKLNSIIWLNNLLVKFGEEPQSSTIKAIKLLKRTVFINIYDLEAEKYETRTTKELLRKALINNPEKRFPLCYAKENKTLKCFLIKL